MDTILKYIRGILSNIYRRLSRIEYVTFFARVLVICVYIYVQHV